MTGPTRLSLLGEVLESVVSWSRLLGSTRAAPFHGLQLSRSQLEALFLIAHRPAPMSPGVLANELKVTRGAVTQLLDGLRQAGLVDQRPHPSDARSRVLTLTAGAGSQVAEFELHIVTELAHEFSDLDDTELATLASLLARTVRH
jgi:DNA-binding MarR family transcriptional regulator